MDLTNDNADATAIIPAQICEDKPPQWNLKIEKKSVNGPCIVTGMTVQLRRNCWN